MSWSLCAVRFQRISTGPDGEKFHSISVLIGALPQNQAPPADCLWLVDGLTEHAACAAFDDGPDYDRSGVPQLLTILECGHEAMRLIARWEVTPKSPRILGAIHVRWELTARVTSDHLPELGEFLQRACIKITQSPARHQPRDAPPHWRASMNYGRMPELPKKSCTIS